MGSSQKKKIKSIFSGRIHDFSKSTLNIHLSPIFISNLCRQRITVHSLQYAHWLTIVCVPTLFLFLAKIQFCYHSVKDKFTGSRNSLLVSTKSQRFCMRFNFLIIKNITSSSEALGPENMLCMRSANVVEKVSIVKYGRNKHVFF